MPKDRSKRVLASVGVTPRCVHHDSITFHADYPTLEEAKRDAKRRSLDSFDGAYDYFHHKCQECGVAYITRETSDPYDYDSYYEGYDDEVIESNDETA